MGQVIACLPSLDSFQLSQVSQVMTLSHCVALQGNIQLLTEAVTTGAHFLLHTSDYLHLFLNFIVDPACGGELDDTKCKLKAKRLKGDPPCGCGSWIQL